ncbi:MAG: signal peptidase I [Candidatus Zixiibacteriota bacterium]|nr:MAG: signal peptidase I [candidate division Zixibacteria bacterium]
MDKNFLLEQFQQTEQKAITRKPVGPKKPKPLWREYVEVILVSLVAATLLRLFIVSAYRVDSASMEDSLYEGDYIFVNKLAYKFGSPEFGDIIIFKCPLDPTRDYIKRIIALPGQTVEIIDKVIYVDNQLAEILPDAKNVDPKIMPAQLSMRDNFGPVQVPSDQYFVLGDHRDASEDSRHWGFVPADYIKGKALVVYWSWEPDQSAPKWSFPYIHSAIGTAWYVLTKFPSHTRWERLFTAL